MFKAIKLKNRSTNPLRKNMAMNLFRKCQATINQGSGNQSVNQLEAHLGQSKNQSGNQSENRSGSL